MTVTLPGADLAIVAQEKIVDYLLNTTHPDNGGKALFFLELGFRADQWQALADAFRRLAVTGSVKNCVASSHGAKYILDGRIETPCGKAPWVRTVWIVDDGQREPRLVTAYPGET